MEESTAEKDPPGDEEMAEAAPVSEEKQTAEETPMVDGSEAAAVGDADSADAGPVVMETDTEASAVTEDKENEHAENKTVEEEAENKEDDEHVANIAEEEPVEDKTEEEPIGDEKEEEPIGDEKEDGPAEKEKEDVPAEKEKEDEPAEKEKEDETVEKEKLNEPAEKEKEDEPEEKEKEDEPEEKEKENEPEEKEKDDEPEEKEKEDEPEEKEKEDEPEEKEKEDEPGEKAKELAEVAIEMEAEEKAAEIDTPMEEEKIPETTEDTSEEMVESAAGEEEKTAACDDQPAEKTNEETVADEPTRMETSEKEDTVDDTAEDAPSKDSNPLEADGKKKDDLTEEPENTEFVQISQEKNEDAQNEVQQIEAEDPFGGDNLIADNVDSPPTGDMAFPKLVEDGAVNLEDAVNAKDGNFKKSGENRREIEDLEDSRGSNAEIAASDSLEATMEDTSRSDDLIDGKSAKETQPTMLEDEEEEEGEEVTTVEASEAVVAVEEDDGKKKDESIDVLPGQDDELCIIPDSMKVATTTGVLQVGHEKDKEKTVAVDHAEKGTDAQESLICGETISNIIAVEDTGDASTKRREDEVESVSPKKKVASSTAEKSGDVIIDIDEESKNCEIVETPISEESCKQCKEKKLCGMSVRVGSETFNVCSDACKRAFSADNIRSTDIPSDGVNSRREKRCASCLLIVESEDDKNLSWETMEFCNEECLGKFQTKYGSYCRNCNGSVQHISLGKYCVRFGYDVRQFCCSSCLEEFKKGLKVCSYCQKDISSGSEGFLAPVGDKGQFKDFCTQYCMEKYSRMNCNEPERTEKKTCGVCQEEKVVHCEVQIHRAPPVSICSDPCLAAFKFVNKVDPEQCSTCKKFFELTKNKSFVVFYEGDARSFCNKTCLNIFIITNRKIVACNWCKVKKYNFDMIKKELKTGQSLMMCSLNCLTLYQVSVNAVSAKRISCDFCKEFSQAQYHLTMSDATIRNFCSYNCVMKFQSQYTKSPITIPTPDDPVPTGMPKRTYPPAKGHPVPVQPQQKPAEPPGKKAMPVISLVTSLASMPSNGQSTQTPSVRAASPVPVASPIAAPTPQVIVNQQVITRPPSPVKIHNKVTQCKPLTHTKGVSVRPRPCPKSTQTDGETRIFVPVPVPIYVPFPVHMWSMPFPIPVPVPLPIPVPIFVPTTRNSAKGIFKDIKRIQEKIPSDPFEAELLMMAEMVATEKKTTESDSESSDDNGRDTTEPVDSGTAFGEDMLQIALKMATGELDEPPVDLETALTPNTITATQSTSQADSSINTDVEPERNTTTANRGRKRMVPYKPRGAPSKRGRRVSGVNDSPIMPPPETQASAQPRMMEPIEKPDANMALKYTFGVNAWRQWVMTKNAQLEKQMTGPRKIKLFKTDLLQLTADELNYTLCLFVKEVRKPNGHEYAPDTIYYLCLGIQQYLFENNRIDNIFTDSYYEKFTDCLNQVAKKFSVLYNEAQYIVTRVEEEHLWECKQLGAHSPHVLLSTLMFFNTKHFNLVTVEEHMQLSFSHIMKHWKRNPSAQAAAVVAGKPPSTRNVLLRFYPPQSALEANSRKKKVYEQQENEENPLRCPVKLYEFYLSKCPESVKTRNDVFYLLPERSCVPDSPVWYSTSALAKEHLIKMLYRVKMVKEINVALLTS